MTILIKILTVFLCLPVHLTPANPRENSSASTLTCSHSDQQPGISAQGQTGGLILPTVTEQYDEDLIHKMVINQHLVPIDLHFSAKDVLFSSNQMTVVVTTVIKFSTAFSCFVSVPFKNTSCSLHCVNIS